ncbi:MAG: hypothetical protein K2K55_06415 [Duncaniella sp.]|nr:hypothetical protein [Duncaniella sp.]
MATADFVTSLAPVLPRVSTGGALVINGATDGPRLAGEMLFVNAKGEKISFDTALPFTFDTNAIISEKALALLGPNVNIVGAVALKNVEWEKVFKSLGSSSAVSFKDKATIAMIRPFLEQTDGTLAVGVGTTLMPGQSLTSLAFDPSALVVSVVVEMKKDEPSKLLQRLKGFASMVGLTASDTAEGFSVTLPDEGITVNARATETALLISTMEINAGGNVSPTMSAINFGGYIAAFGAVIDADSPLQQMFDKGPRQDLTFTLGADMPSSTVSFEIVCGKEGDWVKNMKPYFNQK